MSGLDVGGGRGCLGCDGGVLGVRDVVVCVFLCMCFYVRVCILMCVCMVLCVNNGHTK